MKHYHKLVGVCATIIILLLILWGVRSVSAPTPVKPLSKTTDQLILAGKYADFDIVQMKDKSWRLYFGVEPEVKNTEFEVYTASSNDGVKWEMKKEPVLKRSTLPDAVRLTDGNIRLYFQQAGEIYSAISDDGVTFKAEEGVRMKPSGVLDSDGVAAPTVVQKPDNTFSMVFRVAEKGAYSKTSVNQTMTSLVSATSKDGLTWERGSVLVNGRDKVYDGYVDGPELFYDAKGVLYLRYWAPGGKSKDAKAGHFEISSKDNGKTWSAAKLVVSDVLGGDPTYTYIDKTLYMYYTVHTKGLYLRKIK